MRGQRSWGRAVLADGDPCFLGRKEQQGWGGLPRNLRIGIPRPAATAAPAPTWTRRDVATRTTSTCLCLSATGLHPSRNKGKPRGTFCGEHAPLNKPAAQPRPRPCPVTIALVTTPPAPRLQFFVVLTSQRELFPRLTADLRRFRKPPRLPPEPEAPGSSAGGPGEASGVGLAPGPAPLFPPLAAEVGVARARLAQLVRLAGGHCRRDTLWKRLFLLEPAGPDRLRLGGRLALAELEELLEAVHAKSIGDIDPQLVSSCGFQKQQDRC